MLKENCFNFSTTTVETLPFRHFCSTGILNSGIELSLYSWFEQTLEWGLAETDFYTQFEFSFLNADLPINLRCLISSETIENIKSKLEELFEAKPLELVEVTAHKLIDGHRIGVHNDFIDGEETHRLVIQINPYWTEANGGFLMLFNSNSAEDIAKIIKPLNNSCFGFEISNQSNHAVSTVHNYSRYTLVYTFKENY